MIKTFFALGMVAVLVLSACAPSPTPMLALPTKTAVLPTQTMAAPTPTRLSPTSPPLSQGRTLLVTSAADSGPGTLRQAMQDAQNDDTITFDPAVFPPDAPVTIFTKSGLPLITQGNLTIDASNAGVILDGRNATGEWLWGLQIASSKANIIRGLQISNFGAGISISGYDSESNIIGGDRSIGKGPFGQGNLLISNDYGISLAGGGLNTITGNLIGTDAQGAQTLGNRLGVAIWEGAYLNTIGPNNIIAYNRENGIIVQDMQTVRNTITQNSIHDHGWFGISLWNSGNTEVAFPRIHNFDLQAGTVTGIACPNCTVEIFSDEGNEGAIFEGQTTADDTGIFTFSKGTSFIGPHLTATLTDLDHNTSQFSIPTSGNKGAVGSVILQQGNNLPKTILLFKESRELSDNRIGINPDNLGYPFGHWDSLLNHLNLAGVKRVDMALYEKEPPIDWSMGTELAIPEGMDYFVDDLAEYGIQMNLMLHFWDKEGQALGEELATPRFQNQHQIDDFIEFVRFVVRNFKGRIPYYTIWSEPDACGDDLTKCILPENYIEMSRQVVPVIREEDPEAKIVSATFILGGNHEPIFTFLRSDVVKEFDVISWHPFYDAAPNIRTTRSYYYEYPSIVQEIKQTASASGFTGEYWGTDMAWNSEENCGFPGCRVNGREVQKTDVQVAKYTARAIVMELGLDIATGLDNFINDRPWSYPTMRNLTTVMAGNKPLEISVEIESDAARIMSYGFSLPDGNLLFALWSNGVGVDFDPGVPATLTFPNTSAQKVIGIDVLHGFEQELIIETVNGNLVIRNLLVKDYPIILRVIR
jgi:hypothetical protein